MSNKSNRFQPKRKIYIVGWGTNYACWMQGEIVREMADADLIVFTGGEDIHPALYKKNLNPTTAPNIHRDLRELEEYKRALALGKPMIGICRGAQFLCAMAGGILVQNQDNPTFMHSIQTSDNDEIFVSSCHHQAQYPWLLNKDEYKILGWSINNSAYHEGEREHEEIVNGVVPNDIEVENAYYPKIRALCIQGHPEMIYNRRKQYQEIGRTIKHHRMLLDKLMENKL